MALTAAIDLTVKKPDFKSMKSEIRELTVQAQQAVMAFGEFSPEAIRAEQALAQARDRMDDFNDRVAAVNPDRFAQINTVVQGVARGFQAAQGAMALFGNESEDLEKTLVKLQGAMALAEGLEGLGKIEQQFTAIFNNVISGAKKAFAAIKAGIGSTGIGLLVVALGSIVAYWDDIRLAIFGVSEETKKAKAEQDKYNQSMKELNRERQVLLEGELAGKQTELNDLQAEQNKLNDRYLQIQKELKIIEQGRMLSGVDADQDREKRLRKELKDNAFRVEQLVNGEIKLYKDINNLKEQDQAKEDSRNKANSDKAEQHRKDQLQKEKEHLQRLEAERVKAQDQLISAELSANETARDLRLALIEDEGERLQVEYENKLSALKEAQIKEQIANAQNADALALINKKYADAELLATVELDNKEKQLQQKNADDAIKLAEETAAKEKEIADKAKDEQLKRDEALKASKDNLYKASVDLANAVISLAGEQSKTGKTLALSVIAADTAMAISGALKVTQSASPDNIATGGLAGAAKYIGLAAMILNNAKKARDILKSGQPSAPSPLQVSGGGFPQMAAPQVSSTLPQVSGFEQRVFVTEGDISRTQARVGNTKRVSVVK
jgi:hypothetical protein